jgi:hypothetical protein
MNMTMGKGVKLAADIGALNASIKIIKREWGDKCPDLDENWHLDNGCGVCKAYKTVEVLEDMIKYLKGEAKTYHK